MRSTARPDDRPPYTEAQFADRAHDFTPIEILSRFVPKLPWWARPGSEQRYCSANYILLGLLLAAHATPPTSGEWTRYNQMSVVPPALRARLNRSLFVDAGRCADHTPVHGFMQSYEGLKLPPQDVHNLSCVSGWTAGNFLGPVEEVAWFTRELYRPGGSVVSATAQRHMTDFSAPGGSSVAFYGMGTFNLAWSIGPLDGSGPPAYGHVGDTYGYQSQTTYFPHLDAALAVATNVETDSQAQPADATWVTHITPSSQPYAARRRHAATSKSRTDSSASASVRMARDHIRSFFLKIQKYGDTPIRNVKPKQESVGCSFITGGHAKRGPVELTLVWGMYTPYSTQYNTHAKMLVAQLASRGDGART